MSTTVLTNNRQLSGSRQRALSTVSLHKRVIDKSEQKKTTDLSKNETSRSFRPKLQRLIKQGKIQQILNNDPHSKTNLFYRNSQYDMEKQLAASKRSLSTMFMKAKSKESSINLIKNQIIRAQKEIDIIQRETMLVSIKLQGCNTAVDSVKGEMEQIYWHERSYLQVKGRLAEDEVLLKARFERQQAEMDRQCSQYKLLENRFYALKQINMQITHLIHEAKEISKKHVNDKNGFIDTLNEEMAERELVNSLKADRYRREQQINAIATSLIQREQLQKMLQILFTHRVLQEIIKIKSNNLINEYADIQTAYLRIKSNANIVEPERILRRMEEHDQLYDNALKRAQLLEAELTQLEGKLAHSSTYKNAILSQEGEPARLDKGYYQGREKDKYEILFSEKEKYQEKAVSDEILEKNIEAWARKMFAAYGIKEEGSTFFGCLADLAIKLQQSS